MGSAELVLSQMKMGAAGAVSRRIDNDQKFGQSVMSGVATGDSLWLEVARQVKLGSSAAEASMAMALAAALPRSPARVLALTGRKYPLEEVCGIPFLEADSTRIATYYSEAVSALKGIRDTSVIARGRQCLVNLEDAKGHKLARIDPRYVIKNKPPPAPRRRRRR